MATRHLRVATRGVCSSFPHEQHDDLRVVGEPDAPVILRKRLGSRGRRRFTLSWDMATAGQAWELRQLFQAVGTVGSMNYVPPDETAIVEVRFTEPVRIVRKSAMHHEMSVTVEEVLR
jgi:hypothetical protein